VRRNSGERARRQPPLGLVVRFRPTRAGRKARHGFVGERKPHNCFIEISAAPTCSQCRRVCKRCCEWSANKSGIYSSFLTLRVGNGYCAHLRAKIFSRASLPKRPVPPNTAKFASIGKKLSTNRGTSDYARKSRLPKAHSIYYSTAARGTGPDIICHPKEGIVYNRQIIDGLIAAINSAYDRNPPRDIPFDLIECSLRTPHAKIWVFEKPGCNPFNKAAENTLNPARWVQNNKAYLGRRCPLPNCLQIDLKGSFIDLQKTDFFVGAGKENRACDLYCKGYT
jgi:hypothetical protein